MVGIFHWDTDEKERKKVMIDEEAILYLFILISALFFIFFLAIWIAEGVNPAA